MRPRTELTERQKRKRRKAIFRQSLLALAALLLVAGAILLISALIRGAKKPSPPKTDDPPPASDSAQPTPSGEEPPAGQPAALGPASDAEPLMEIGEAIQSECAILIDADANVALAVKNADQTIYPASMTKVMTVLTAAEAIPDLNATFTMTGAIIDPLYRQGATITGLRAGESVTALDLLYGAALRSAADAAEGLAALCDGDTPAFLLRMNSRARELGLSDTTHFSNPSGVFAEDHVTTARDEAAIMRAAMENEICARVLSTVKYVTAPTPSEPEGLTFYNKYLDWFAEKQPERNTVTACKSGYVWQAKNCIVTYAVGESGRHYICVTAGAPTAAAMMKDQRLILSTYGG